MRFNAINIITANVWTQLYQVPSGKSSTLTVNCCNRTNTPATIDIAISSSATTPLDADVIVFGKTVFKPEEFVKASLAVGSLQYVLVRSTQIDVSVNVWGF